MDGSPASPSCRRQRPGLSAGEAEGRSARRLYDSGRSEHLRDVSPGRRQNREVGARSRRRPALESRARQSSIEAAEGSRSVWRSTDRCLTDEMIPPITARAGHEIHPPHPHPSRATDQFWGTPDVSLGHRAGAGGLRRAPGRRTIPDRLSRPLCNRLQTTSARRRPTPPEA